MGDSPADRALRLTCHGAARGVTGSCHLIEVAGHRLLIDCGMFQGSRELDEENAQPFGFDPAAIDWLVLTHAHLDHCGRVPLLVRRGFRGEIITTGATRDLARLVMLDAGHLEEEEAARRARQARRRGAAPAPPLYTMDDALWAMDFFGRGARYGEALELAPGLRVTFRDAGHILGSASVEVQWREEGTWRRMVCSGDLGNRGRPLLRPPAPPPAAEVLLMECTYGDRCHRSIEASVEELWGAVADTLERGGNVIIPTFALERAQEVLYFLREGIERGVLPRGLPVFLDSPMAISATQVFRRHPDCFRAELSERIRSGWDPFAMPGLRFTRETAESMALNQVASGAVIMAGSGMCTGGRVRHHLKHNLWREEASVIMVGYAARGTLGRALVDGAREVQLFGERIPVRARIHTINGFSAHADHDELVAWATANGCRHVLLVHGEPDRGMRAMAEALRARGVRVDTPAPHRPLSIVGGGRA